jgi:hypothetical protein
MTANSISSPSSQNTLRRFTLMLPGEDALDSEDQQVMGGPLPKIVHWYYQTVELLILEMKIV